MIEEGEASIDSNVEGNEVELSPDPILVRICLQVGTSGVGVCTSG